MVSAGDAAKIRYPYHSVAPVFIHIPKLATYATAKINQAAFTYPLTEIDVDNTSADWANADRVQMCRVYSGSTIRYQGGMANSPTANKLRLRNINEGDPGLAQEIYSAFADNDDITIYQNPYPDAVRSRIDSVTERTLKYRYIDFDNYANAPTQYPPPVNRVGRNQFVAVASGGSASVTFPHNGDDGGYSWNSGNLTYQWETLPTGVTLDSGALTDAVINVTATPGNYVLQRQLEDDTAAEGTTGRRWLFVTDGPGGTNPAFSDVYPPTSLKIDDQDKWSGFRGTFTIAVTRGQHSDLMDYLYPGAPVLVQETQRYSNDNWATVATTTAYAVPDQWFGYLRQYNSIGTDAQGRDVIEVEFVSPLIYYQSLPIAMQVLREVNPPTTWQQAHPDMMHTAHLAFYLANWHARQLFTSHDFYFDTEFTTRKKAAFLSNEDNVGTALQRAAEFVPGGYFTCGYDGSMYMKRLLNLMNTADRNAVSTAWTWQAGDYRGEFRYSRNPLMLHGETDGAGFIYGTGGTTTTSRARMGLNAPFGGIGKANFPDLIIESASEMVQVTGDAHAFNNRPTQDAPIRTRHETVDPALLEPVAFSMSSYDPASSGAFSNRGVVAKISRTYKFTKEGVVKENLVTVIPETNGTDATSYNVDAIGDVADSEAWAYNYDFTTGQAGFTVSQGSYVAATGFRSASIAGGDGTKQRITVASDEALVGTITEITACLERDASDTITGDSMAFRLDSDVLVLTPGTVADSGVFSFEWTGSQSCASRSLVFAIVYLPTTTTTVLKSICIKGTGTRSNWFADNGATVSDCPTCS